MGAIVLCDIVSLLYIGEGIWKMLALHIWQWLQRKKRTVPKKNIAIDLSASILLILMNELAEIGQQTEIVGMLLTLLLMAPYGATYPVPCLLSIEHNQFRQRLL